MPWRHGCGLRHRAPVSHVPKSLWDFARRAALRAGWGAGSASRGRCGYCCLLALVLGLVDEVGATPVAGALGPGVGAGIADVPAADSAALADARRSHTRTESAAGRSIACIEVATLLLPEAHRPSRPSRAKTWSVVRRRWRCGRLPRPSDGSPSCRLCWRVSGSLCQTGLPCMALCRSWSRWPGPQWRDGCRWQGIVPNRRPPHDAWRRLILQRLRRSRQVG